MIYNNKQIFYIDRKYWDNEINISSFPYDFYGDVIFNIGQDYPDIQQVCKTVLVNNIEENSTLYFGKTSKFPRYKIKDLNYKRCVKVDKSDYQVVGNIKYDVKSKLYLFENDDCYYCVFGLDGIDIIKETTYSLKKKIKYIEEKYKATFREVLAKVGCCSKLIWEDLSRILSGEFTKCIKDEDLDAIINKKMEPLTKEDVDILYDMLNSTDPASIDLGLQMLVGYDVSDVPCTVRLLLRNSNIKNGKAWNSTGVKQVKNSINFNATGWHLMFKDYYAFDNYKYISDLDKELSYYLWSKMVIKDIEGDLEKYNLPGLKFKCHAETE